MEKLVHDIIEALLPQSDTVLYIFLFVSAIVENLFPPIPGDTITAFGAFLVGTGRLDYWLVYIATTLGSVIGFMCLFFVGRLVDREFFIAKNYRFFSAQSIIKAEQWFGKYGFYVVLANRFLPGIRSVISIVSGMSNLNAFKVFMLSLMSALVWNLIWIHAGYSLGNNWDLVRENIGNLMRTYNIAAGIVIVCLVAGYIIIKMIRKKRSS